VRPFECGQRPCGTYGREGTACYACFLFDAIERGERVDSDFVWNAETGQVETRRVRLGKVGRG